MEHNHVTGILVTDDEGRLLGILTRRDIMFVENDDLSIGELMTPSERLITAPEKVSLEEAKKLFRLHKVEKFPIVGADGMLKGLVTIKDIKKCTDFPLATKDEKGRLRVGAAIGVKRFPRARAGLAGGARRRLLVLDIAHGHSDYAIDATRIEARASYAELIVGNVATPDGIRDLLEEGVETVKVGVGPGSICITRIVTGAGVPQLSAIWTAPRRPGAATSGWSRMEADIRTSAT